MSSNIQRSGVYMHAYEAANYTNLMTHVNRFFALEPVKAAMNDYATSVSERFRNAVCPTNCWPESVPMCSAPTFFATAKALCLAINHTQKEIAYQGGFDGMTATSQAHELLGRLLKGEEFIHKARVLDTIKLQKPIVDSHKRFRVLYAIALELEETRNALPIRGQRDKTFPITKVTHGLHLGLEEIGSARIPDDHYKRGYSHGLSPADLNIVWNYPDPITHAFPDPKTLSDRMQGADFRYRKVAEEGRKASRQLPNQEKYKWQTIIAEVGGKKNVRDGAQPEWFSDDSFEGITGPQHPGGETLSLNRPRIEEQMRQTIDQIAALIYEYPKR